MAFSNPSSNLLDEQILQDLGESSATAVMDVGRRVEASPVGKAFQYVCFASSGVAAISGAPAVYSNCTAQVVVTSDISDTDTEGGAFAGVFCSDQAGGGAAANQVYLWIQTKGYVTDAYVDTGVEVGDYLSVGQNAAGDKLYALEDFDTSAGALYRGVAIAQEADTSGKADIILL